MDKQLEKVNEIGDAKNVQRSNVFSFQKPIKFDYKTSKIKKQRGDEENLKKNMECDGLPSLLYK